MKPVLLLLLVVSVSFSCTQRKSIPITEVSQKDMESGILVDVRTPGEFSAGHLENAVNIDWNAPNFAEQFSALDKGKTVYVYCKKGGRSAKAAGKLDSLGYDVVDLLGGYDAFMASKSQ